MSEQPPNESGQDEEPAFHYGSHDEGHGDGGHGEPWLVSYADMMTLLFGFFVIMYAFAAAKLEEDPDIIKMRKELATFYGGTYVNPLEVIEKDIQKTLANNPDFKKNTDIVSDLDGIKITITSQVLFESGKSEITVPNIPAIKSLIKEIGKGGKNYKIRVEGYTDDTPIHNERFPSNWELSASRAISVLKQFEDDGFDIDNLQAVGFGEAHPLLPNENEKGEPLPENKSRNRRVVIRVVPADEVKNQKPTQAPLAAPANEAEEHK